MANSTINQLEYHGTLYDVEDTAARTGLETKADAADVYTKTDIDTALGNKADKSTTYTKTEVDTALSDKADTTDIPTTLAELTGDSTHRVVTDTEKSTWDNKVDKVQGKSLSTNDYTNNEKTKLAGIAEGAEVNVQPDWNQTTTTADDYIKNKPSIPTVNDSTITIQKNGVAVDSFTTNAATGKTINITVPTTAAEVDALPDTTKYAAGIELSIDPSTFVVTIQLKDQNDDNIGKSRTIDLPLESVVVSGSYNSQTKKVVLTLQSGSTVEFSVADLVAGLQSEITAQNPLSSDLVDDTNATHKFVTASEKTTWNSKQDTISDLSTIRSGASAGATAVQPAALNDYATTAAMNTALGGKQDTLSQAQLSAVNSGATAAKIDQISTNQSDISSLDNLETEDRAALAEVVDNGTKNELSLSLTEMQSINGSGQGASWSGNVCTIAGITFTVNDDMTITINGTLAGERALFRFFYNRTNVWGGKILSGCPQGGTSSSYAMALEQIASPWGTLAQDYGNGSQIGTSTATNIYGYILIRQSINNLTFKPMICTKAAWDISHKYVPYRPSYTTPAKYILKDKKIVYNGDSICESRFTGFAANGGGYAKLIADETGCIYENRAVSGGTLAVVSGKHNICTDIANMSSNADLVCFEGGINDYWNNVPLGTYSETDYASGTTGLDMSTVCGALEAIIRQAIARWTGVPICFVIVHKIAGTAYTQNSAGYTFAEMREKMIGILNKYSIPYYDCYKEGGLNGYIWYLNNAYLNGGGSEHPDGCHPDEGGYRRYYVPQLIDLFTRIMPVFK